MQKIILAGASGLVGKKLYSRLRKEYSIILIGRNPDNLKSQFPKAYSYIGWGEIEKINYSINLVYGIINLSGAPIVSKRWSKNYKKILINSRIATTKRLVDGIKKAKSKPEVLINASAVGYYGIKDAKKPFDELDENGNDFLAKLSKQWEAEAMKANALKVRTVTIRSGIVLDGKEGALPKILAPFKFYAGGPIGTGRQKFPWIHIDDEVGIIIHALNNNNVTGPINAVAPEIVTSRDLSRTIGELIHLPSIIPVPKFFLKVLYGEASQVLTTGVSVSSEKIVNLGYKFKFKTIEEALSNILN